MKMIKVLVVDDHPVFREGLTRVLAEQGDIEVIGQAGTAEEALKLANDLIPDIAIIDIALPQIDGIELARQIKTILPSTAIIMLSAYDFEAYVVSSLGAGAAGYLLKDTCSHDIINAVRSVHAGDAVFNLKAVSGVLKRFSNGQGCPKGTVQLSEREVHILKLAAAGETNKEIATQLFISERTVQSHMINVYRKLKVKSRTEAVLHALHTGWLTLDDLKKGKPYGQTPEAI